MRKLLGAAALTLLALGAPAGATELGWSEFASAKRAHDRPYLYLVADGYGRWNRLAGRQEGYFYQRGGVDVSGGRALFDYDRDYPYDYPSYSTMVEEEVEAMRAPSCTFERVSDGKSGWTDVRVCRN